MAVNAAVTSNGATATATSTAAGGGFEASNAIDGYRAPLVRWDAGGIWHSAVPVSVASPQILTVTFASAESIKEISVTTVRDSFTDNRAVRSLTETFTQFGIQDFTVEANVGGSWVTLATVTNNNKIWRQLRFAAVVATAVRIVVTKAADGYARIAEIEAFDEPTSISHVLFIGNSITKIPAYSDYPLTAGMAATTANDDFVHQYIQAITPRNPGVTFRAEYAATGTVPYAYLWEGHYDTFDLSNFDDYFTVPPDLIYFCLGENANWSPTLEAKFGDFLDYAAAHAPQAVIKVKETFWNATVADPQVNVAMKAAADARGLQFIPCAFNDIPGARRSDGDIVIRDDNGQPFALHSYGVLLHPNDYGHKLIADTLVAADAPGIIPIGGINVGSSSAVGIYGAEGGGGGTNVTQPADYDFQSIKRPPADAVINSACYSTVSFSRTVSGLTPGLSYFFRVFSSWDSGYSFSITANGINKGMLVKSGTHGIVTAFSCAAAPDEDGEIEFTFTQVSGAFALVNAIDWGLPFEISTDVLPPVIIGGAAAYSQQLDATGGAGAVTYSTDSSLPAGLTLSERGLLSGATTALGSYSITVLAIDGGGAGVSKTFALNIIEQPIGLSRTGLQLYVEPDLDGFANYQYVNHLKDYSLYGRDLTLDANPALAADGALNGYDVVGWNGTANPLQNDSSFEVQCGFMVFRIDQPTFTNYAGILTDTLDFSILVGNNATTDFYDFPYDDKLFELRVDDRIYSRDDLTDQLTAPAPMETWSIVFFRFWKPVTVSGIQIGQDRTDTARKANMSLALLALYDAGNVYNCEAELRRAQKELAAKYGLTIQPDVYPFAADKVSQETPNLTTNIYDPPEGNRIAETIGRAETSLSLKFSSRRMAEIKEMKRFWLSHYPEVPCIFRNYKTLPPIDIEGYIDSPYQLTGGIGSFEYQFDFKGKKITPTVPPPPEDDAEVGQLRAAVVQFQTDLSRA